MGDDDMKKRNICILYGGKSREHEVSCRSAAAVCSNIDASLFSVQAIGIAHDGRWYLQPQELLSGQLPQSLPIEERKDNLVSAVPGEGLVAKQEDLPIDFVFPVLHGSFGEDGTVQGLLELADLPYAGSNVLGSALGMDKEKIKTIWQQEGLPVVPFLALGKKEFFGDGEGSTIYRQAIQQLGSPLFVKPVASGSSVGVSKVSTENDFFAALEKAFRIDTRVMVEPALQAREIECSVVGNHSPTAYPPGEIISRHEFYDYQAKYIDDEGARLVVPADISSEQQAEIQDIAVKAFVTGGIHGYARVDFFIEKTSNRIYLNEINTIPGFTSISMFPIMCRSSGVSFKELITTIIEFGMEQYNETRALNYQYEE